MAAAAVLTQNALPVRAWTKERKIEESMLRGLKFCPKEVGMKLSSFFTRANFAIIIATFLLWAAAHTYGVGEATDFALLIVGTAFVGWGFWKGLRDLVDFAVSAVNANSDFDLDKAGKLFAAAVVELGVDTLMALLLKKPLTGAASKAGRITHMNLRPGLRNAIAPPPPGPRTITTVYNLPSHIGGLTDPYGNIQLNGNWPAVDLEWVLDHEKGHAALSPLFSLLRQFRANLADSAYNRSVFLRYLEEAVVHARALALQQLRGKRPGTLSDAIIAGFKHPLNGGYRVLVTDTRVDVNAIVGANIGAQAQMLGVIFVDGHMMNVSLYHEPDQPNTNQPQSSTQK